MMIEQQHDALQGKRIVILGLARQGIALARFASRQGASVVVSDRRSAAQLADWLAQLPDDVERVLGDHPLTLLDGADFVAVSGGVPLDIPIVRKARKKGIALTNDSQEFQRRSPAPVIGITGSAGKSTTTSLVGAMGSKSGRATWVGGNLGFPLLNQLDDIRPGDIVVQELSSFQLEIATVSPAIAAVLNISPNHLDRHKTMAAYINAKANILRFQQGDDVAVLPYERLPALEPLVAGRLRYFSAEGSVGDGAFLDGDRLLLRDGERERLICRRQQIRLRGEHNVLNVLAAIVLADSAGIDAEAIAEAIAEFSGIPHRLQPVALIDGVLYIDDSIATAPERSLAAINAFDEPIVLLAGGQDKDLDWQPWADRVAQRVKTVVAFGELARAIGALLAGRVDLIVVDDLTAAVDAAADVAAAGDVVLLAPGGTSFDAYSNFAARGDHFAQLVNTIVKEKSMDGAPAVG